MKVQAALPMGRKGSQCKGCPLGGRRKVPARGPSSARMLVVGEAPGEVEARAGRPFAGPSGGLLAKLMERARLDPAQARATNAVLCPRDGEEVPRDALERCSENLREEIERPGIEVVVLLGATALKSVLGLEGVKKHRGRRKGEDGRTYVITYNPAHALREPSIEREIERDLRLAARVEEPDPLPDYSVEPGNDLSGPVAFDLETSGLYYWRDRPEVRCAGLAWARGEAWAGGPGVPEAVRKILEDEHVPKVGHNAKFDALWARVAGVEVRGLAWDTMIAAYLLDEDRARGGLSLDRLAAEFVPDMPEHKRLMDAWGDPSRCPDAKLLSRYCAADCDATLRLYEAQRVEIEADSRLDDLLKKHLVPMISVLAEIEFRGILIDREELNRRSEDLGARIAMYEQGLTGLGLGDPGSTKALREALEKHLPASSRRSEKTGEVSLDEETLQAVVADELASDEARAMAEMLLEWRGMRKIKGTYLDGLAEWIDGAGRVHPSYHLCGTVSGRITARDPAFQIVPESCRPVYRADPGKLWVSFDYSQIELRCAAWLSQDKNMIEAFRSGLDLHDALVQMGIARTRKEAKGVNFSILYGADHELARAWFARFPAVAAWIRRQHEAARREGVVWSAVGRPRRIREANASDRVRRSAAERQAQNSPIQGLAADLGMRAAFLLRRDLPELEIFGLVHDSVEGQVPEDRLDLVAKAVEIMEGVGSWDLLPRPMNVPLKVDAEVGPAWGKGDKWKQEI